MNMPGQVLSSWHLLGSRALQPQGSVCQTTSTRLYAGGDLQGSPVWQALAGHKRRCLFAFIGLGVTRVNPSEWLNSSVPGTEKLLGFVGCQ